MGLIGRIVGGPAATTALASAATQVAEVFVPNATRRMELSAEAYRAALDEYGEEFKHVRPGVFDRFVNGLNRLPRPMLALGTLGLFVYAMVDPQGFADRMVGLAYVPEPLWWLLGAIVGFYFGAREAHYFRSRQARDLPPPGAAEPEAAPAGPAPAAPHGASPGAPPAAPRARRGGQNGGQTGSENPALDQWRAAAGGRAQDGD